MDIHHTAPDPKYPLNYITEPASLQELVLTRLALDIWRHGNLFITWIESWSKPTVSWQGKDFPVQLPPRMVKLIDERIQSVLRELRMLNHSLNRSTIFEQNRCTVSRILSNCFDSLTYGPDGRICIERNVRNLLTRPELTDLEKFKLACVYWVENDVRRLWPSVRNSDEIRRPAGILAPFLTFWVKKMTSGDIESFQLYGFWNLEYPVRILHNWTAFEFILNSLDVKEQRNYMRYILRAHDNINLKHFLSKLNELQANCVLSEHPIRIIINLAVHEGCFEYTLKIWNLIREIINYTQFIEMINYLFEYTDARIWCYEQARALLVEIWINTPDRLKNQFFDNRKDSCGCADKLIVPRFSHYFHFHKIFFLKLYSDMPLRMRTRILECQNCRHTVISNSPIEFLNPFLNICLGNENDTRRFIETEILNYSKVKTIIEEWFQKQLYDKIIDYSNLCTWNMQLVREFIRQIFPSIIPPLPSFGSEKLFKLCEAIDKKLSRDEANDIRRTILFCENVQKLLRSMFLQEWYTSQAIEIIDRFLPTERSLGERQLFLDRWRIMLTTKGNNLGVNRWKGFLFWWVGDDVTFSVYKRYFLLHDIFKKLILEAIDEISSKLNSGEMKRSDVRSSAYKFEEFAYVDNFLLWYFGTDAAVKDFKRSEILNHRKMDALRRKILNTNNNCILYVVLRWFFDDDLSEVERFRNKFGIRKD